MLNIKLLLCPISVQGAEGMFVRKSLSPDGSLVAHHRGTFVLINRQLLLWGAEYYGRGPHGLPCDPPAVTAKPRWDREVG